MPRRRTAESLDEMLQGTLDMLILETLVAGPAPGHIKYHRLTPEGREKLTEQTSRWDRLVRAINLVIRPVPE